jgi:uncharacterized repeat protein (TIGR01451 family)
MKKKKLLSLTTIALFLLSSISFSQTLELGTLEPFGSFAGVGAVTSSGTSTGDAGTNAGAITGTGFELDYCCTTHTSSALTVQARIDLLRVYIHLDDVFVDYPSTHLPAFGGGEVITPGVYSIGGAGSLAGTVTLNGGGDPDAVFIIKFEGAFTVGTGSEVILAGGTRAANVYWISQGAISVGSSSDIRGTLFAHPGAVTLGVGSTIEGRLLTSEGAITIAADGAATMPVGPSTIKIKCLGDCSSAPTVDVLGSLKEFAMFTTLGAVANAATSGIVGAIGSHGGAISGFETSTHTNSDATTGVFYNSDAVTAQAVIDLDNAYEALMALENTITAHTPAFGSGETLTNGVYHIAGAGSLAGTITLDAEDNPDAIFVFKFAGAFSVAAQSRVILINGAKRCNVFWISGAGVATGAMDLGTFTYMKGTLIAHGGACSAGANASIEGRMLSTGGAIGFSTGVIYNDTLCFDPPVISVIDAVVDNVGPIEGSTGGTTTALTSNDTLNGSPVVIGEEPGNVSLIGVDVPRGLTLNADGTVTVTPDIAGGTYEVEYQICEFGNPTNCDTVISTIVVLDAPAIDAVQDTLEPVNGSTGGTTIALTDNDTLNGEPVVIGEEPGNVSLTGVDIPRGLTLNEDGTVTVDSNIAGGLYDVEYQICEFGNPTNCDTVISTILVLDPPVIDAVTDTLEPVNGTIGGTTIALTDNDTLNGELVVIGEEPGNVSLTGVDVPRGLTLNEDGTVTITSNISGGLYDVEYQICEFGNPTNCDTVISTILVTEPEIALIKEATVGGTGNLGEVITYTFTVENTGDTALTNVMVTDPMVGLIITGNPIISLEAGESSSTITGTYTITQKDIDAGGVTNTALATAKDPNGTDITDVSGATNEDDDQTVTTLTQSTSIALVKSAILSGTGALGDIITFIFTIENTGNTTLTNLEVTDPMVGLVFASESSIASLAPGATTLAMATYTITQTDIDNGNVTNSATVIAQDPNENPITDTSGTANDNDTNTVVIFIQTPIEPDFAPAIDIDALVFLPDGLEKDFIVNVSEVKGAQSDGPVVLKITKGNAFVISYNPNASNSSVNGGTPVNNNDWLISENATTITMTLKDGKIIASNSFSSIGFTINRGSDVPTQTNQSITVAVVNGSGGDSEVFNNTYNTVVKAQ